MTGPVPATYCDHCGRPRADGDHTRCVAARSLEPPRYCTACARRMVVQVTPRAWSARCPEHGAASGDSSMT